MPTVCAIIPTFNRAQYIKECIDSLLLQSQKIDQIIVVNDGSTDNTLELLRDYEDKITVISKENGGKSSSLNLGMQYCKSDYVWVCDDDDIASPEGLAHLLGILSEDPSVDIAFGSYNLFVVKEGEKVFSDPSYWARDNEPNYKICFMEGMFAPQFSMIVRRSLYEAVGPFNENFVRSQDFEMTLRLTRHAKIRYTPQIIYFYREHSGTRGTEKYNFSALESFKKWHQFEGLALTSVYNSYKLSEFTPTFAYSSPELQKTRSQYLQRSLIMASRGLWSEASDDISLSSDYTGLPLSTSEIKLLNGYLKSKLLFIDLLNNRQAIKKISCTFHRNNLGRLIVRHLFLHLLWKSKKALMGLNINDFLLYIRILLKIWGIYATTIEILNGRRWLSRK